MSAGQPHLCRPHISVITSMSRWISSRNTGRLGKPRSGPCLDHPASLPPTASANGAADELLSEAVAPLPVGEGFGDTVRAVYLLCELSDCRRVIPTPTMLIGAAPLITGSPHLSRGGSGVCERYPMVTGGVTDGICPRRPTAASSRATRRFLPLSSDTSCSGSERSAGRSYMRAAAATRRSQSALTGDQTIDRPCW